MQRRSSFLTNMRRHGEAVTLAVATILLQLVFATAHLSALAVAVAEGGASGKPLGFLQICTAEGLRQLPSPADSSGDRSGQPAEHCLLCGGSAVDGGQNLASAADILSGVSFQIDTREAPPPETIGHAPTVQRAGTLRGPPRA